jgi:hypothetical protein
VYVPAGDELVARGACVQAAAVLGGGALSQFLAAWKLGDCAQIDPDLRVDAASVRAAYTRARG